MEDRWPCGIIPPKNALWSATIDDVSAAISKEQGGTRHRRFSSSALIAASLQAESSSSVARDSCVIMELTIAGLKERKERAREMLPEFLSEISDERLVKLQVPVLELSYAEGRGLRDWPIVPSFSLPGVGKSKLALQSLGQFYSKAKRGLSGFANGSRISAFPDTGSSRNVVSEAFVRELDLNVEGSPCEFKLGNSQKARSIGELLVLVKMVRWLMDSSRHSELRLGILGKCYQYHDHRLRCTSSV